MSFGSGGTLWLLLLLPALVLLHAWLELRRKRWPLRISSIAVAKEARMASRAWKRHVPPALLLAGFGAAILAASRPMAVVTLPMAQQTIVLAMDVSGSMRAADVYPNRLIASQQAANAFVAGLPRDVKVGVVSYGGTAHLVQAPTRNRQNVFDAINGFRLQPGTSIGNGLVVALATLFPHRGIEVEQWALRQKRDKSASLDDMETANAQFADVPPGSYRSAVVVLLSDGQNTTGADPADAADLAARLGVKVFTVGFGTPDGDTVTFGGWTIRVRIDEPTLRRIAQVTHGEYFYAATGEELQAAYRTMASRIAVERAETELSGIFAGLAALLLAFGAGMSLCWHAKLL